MSLRAAVLGLMFVVATFTGPATAAPAEVPNVLSEEDINRYRSIFELQEQAKWKQADKLIARLENPVLMGHVWFQRYMHPTGYRSKYSELSNWLSEYADHPNAWPNYHIVF